MSIKIMSAVFETEFPGDFEYVKNGQKRTAKASTVKLLLLAIADHCNDDGIAYPGLSRLEVKTALSRQGVIDTIEALKYNGILEVVGVNDKHKTNMYQLNLNAFTPTLKNNPAQNSGGVVKPLDQGSQATLPEVVKPLDLNHHLTIIKSLTETDYENVNKQVLDMIGLSDKAKKRTDTLLPEQYQEFGRAFTEATGLQYMTSQQKKWVGAFEDWNNLGVKVDDIKSAVQAMNGYTITSPMSLTNTLNGIVARRKVDNDPYKNFNWLD
jgi:hypothetical protein